jgi:mediator of RNA polymerase II transcription subunit 17
MGSKSSDFPISLQPSPSKPDSAGELSSLFARIYDERGGLRNITEESLRQEIAEEEAAAAAGEDNVASDAEEEPEEEPDRLKTLMTARADMLVRIQYVHSLQENVKTLINLQ